MAWIRAALVSAILLASGAATVAQEQEDGPVPPVYVPEEQQDGVPADRRRKIPSNNAKGRAARPSPSRRPSELTRSVAGAKLLPLS